MSDSVNVTVLKNQVYIILILYKMCKEVHQTLNMHIYSCRYPQCLLIVSMLIFFCCCVLVDLYPYLVICVRPGYLFHLLVSDVIIFHVSHEFVFLPCESHVVLCHFLFSHVTVHYIGCTLFNCLRSFMLSL